MASAAYPMRTPPPAQFHFGWQDQSALPTTYGLPPVQIDYGPPMQFQQFRAPTPPRVQHAVPPQAQQSRNPSPQRVQYLLSPQVQQFRSPSPPRIQYVAPPQAQQARSPSPPRVHHVAPPMQHLQVVQVPVYIERPVYIHRIIEKPVYVERIVEKTIEKVIEQTPHAYLRDKPIGKLAEQPAHAYLRNEPIGKVVEQPAFAYLRDKPIERVVEQPAPVYILDRQHVSAAPVGASWNLPEHMNILAGPTIENNQDIGTARTRTVGNSVEKYYMSVYEPPSARLHTGRVHRVANGAAADSEGRRSTNGDRGLLPGYAAIDPSTSYMPSVAKSVTPPPAAAAYSENAMSTSIVPLIGNTNAFTMNSFEENRGEHRPYAVGDVGAWSSAAWKSSEEWRSVEQPKNPFAIGAGARFNAMGSTEQAGSTIFTGDIGAWPSGAFRTSGEEPQPNVHSNGIRVLPPTAGSMPPGLVEQRTSKVFTGDIGAWPSAAFRTSMEAPQPKDYFSDGGVLPPTAGCGSSAIGIVESSRPKIFTGDIGAWPSSAFKSDPDVHVEGLSRNAGAFPPAIVGESRASGPTERPESKVFSGDIGAWPSSAFQSSGEEWSRRSPGPADNAMASGSRAKGCATGSKYLLKRRDPAEIARDEASRSAGPKIFSGDIGAWPSSAFQSSGEDWPADNATVAKKKDEGFSYHDPVQGPDFVSSMLG